MTHDARLNLVVGETPEQKAEYFLEPESVKTKSLWRDDSGNHYWTSGKSQKTKNLEFLGYFNMHADYRVVLGVMQ